MSETVSAPAEQEIQAAFRAAGVDGFLHAIDVDRGTELGYQPDAPVVLASVFKVPLLVEFERQVAAGRIDERERARVPAAFRVPGPTGISAMVDDVELSWRDLAQLMIAVSDNTATDFLGERIGLDNVAATLRELGLERTVIGGDCRTILRAFQEDMGLSWPPQAGDMELVEAAGRAPMATNRALRPDGEVRSTAREMARLFTLIWRDQAGAASACAEMRRILFSQVWRDRLRSGFQGRERVGAKTGTLWGIRNEAGVVEVPDRGRVAVAVFTRSLEPRWIEPAADHVIGTAARIGVGAVLQQGD
jgi:beta-lactamase class A